MTRNPCPGILSVLLRFKWRAWGDSNARPLVPETSMQVANSRYFIAFRA